MQRRLSGMDAFPATSGRIVFAFVPTMEDIMTDERDYYTHNRTRAEFDSSSGGGLWAGLAILALFVLIATFYLFSGGGPENGTGAPDMAPAPVETPAPSTTPAPVQ